MRSDKETDNAAKPQREGFFSRAVKCINKHSDEVERDLREIETRHEELKKEYEQHRPRAKRPYS